MYNVYVHIVYTVYIISQIISCEVLMFNKTYASKRERERERNDKRRGYIHTWFTGYPTKTKYLKSMSYMIQIPSLFI